ncbi:MinD/ParA family protein [Saccharospirillum salsuginis]|uniref:Site-determining protein n=1 Tax=Saccharospirillum salsuginis TaxID=418750 RepID=A0A918K702_9GAMM|nr:MinD/ParA family protein [Saccharospirillum salsuginis]GGX50818.1 site-determining protein [Saccharospirillum salsuginis]
MSGLKPIQVLAVTGGKGGVGKSNVSVNVAVALAEQGKRVVLLDADLGLANIDVLLGISSGKNIADVLAGEAELRDIMVPGPGGIKVIPASSGTQQMANLGEREHAGIIGAFSELGDQMDVLIVDTAAGISRTVTNFVRAAQETLIVVTDEPTSVTDAYALIKVLNRDCKMDRFRVLANMVRTPKEGQNLFNKLVKVTDRFLDVTLQYVGSVPMDESVRKAVQRQKAVIEAYPRSKAAIAYRSLAQKVATWPLPQSPRGNLEFFVERLVQGAGVA